MTRLRPYRRDVFAAADAIGELQRQSGSQFDPRLVPLFVELHNEGKIVAQ
jgi:HD-GYP domain-containing protein (c-di-GMP phosphodiesterase class II)